FGMTRPILNSWHPESRKLTYWFPTIFILLLIAAVIGFVFGRPIPLLLFAIYFGLAFIMALLKTNFVSALMVIPAILIQFFGYGWGFLKSTLLLKLSRKTPQQLFPNLFFSNQ
ncbi:MAG: glycosyl transferase family 2, partial [Flavobacteriaceae bacterium]|nr:glycosyl transferase family 2 [Flavobacteriaceae bacterium]